MTEQEVTEQLSARLEATTLPSWVVAGIHQIAGGLPEEVNVNILGLLTIFEDLHMNGPDWP